MGFWIVTVLLAAASAAVLGLAILRASRSTDTPAAAYDLQVYRDQLGEIERDRERGVLAADEAERLRAEVARRILAADAEIGREAQTPGRAAAGSVPLVGAIVLVVLGGSLFLYRELGAPGYGDVRLADRIAFAEARFANRPTQDEAEAAAQKRPPPEGLEQSYLDLVADLRKTVATRPTDLEGNRLLARHEAAVGNFAAAHKAQARVLLILGAEATADDYVSYADLLTLAADGYVSPSAENALRKAFELEPRHQPARYLWGLMMAQNARPDIAFRIWDGLMREGPFDAPWAAAIRNQITQVADAAGISFRPPVTSSGRGPSAEDVAAADNMSEGDRQEMIEGMVQGLADRLAAEGGPAEDWARLIGALVVLDRRDEAEDILADARSTFASEPEALATIEAAAQRAGISP